MPTQKTTRRGFLGAGAGVAALMQAVPGSAQTPGAITVRQTAGVKRFADEPDLNWQAVSGSTADAIVVDTSRTYQEIAGFGAALRKHRRT